MKRIIRILMLCTSLWLLSVSVSAYGNIACEIQPVWQDGTPVNSSISPGVPFKLCGTVTNNGSSESVSCSVYCGVYIKNELYSAYKSSTVAVGAGESAGAVCNAEIPADIPSDNYYIKGFILTEDNASPLCDSLSFNASGAYTAVYVSDGVYLGENVIKNGSCEYENSFADAWDSRQSSRLEKSGKYQLDGSYSCLVTDRENYWDSVTQDITARLKKSGQYYISYAFCSDSENFGAYGQIKLYGAESGTKSIYCGASAPSSTSGNWKIYSMVKTIDISEDLVRAEFYIESGASFASSDYYIDGICIMPVITHKEYIADNAAADTTENDYEALVRKYRNQTSSVLYPAESSDILINPYKGLTAYKYNSNYDDLLNSGVPGYCGTVYTRYSWKYLEPERGVYNFEPIRENIRKLKENGLMLCTGLASTLNYNSPSSYNQDTPEWLFSECGAEYVLQPMGDGNSIKVPVYNDPIFLEEYKKLIDAFAEEFRDCTDIAYVDMRSYGNWGEWHFSNLTECKEKAKDYTLDDLKRLIDVYENVRQPLAVFTQIAGIQDYALKKYNAGIRVDGTMNPELSDNHRRLAADGRSFAVGEWFDQPTAFYKAGYYNGTYYSDGKWADYFDYMPVMMEKTVKEGRLNYMAMGYWDPIQFYTCFPDLCRRLANKTGYWFKPVKVSYPESLVSGLFCMTMKNDGYTELYTGYKRNSCVKLALADDAGNIIDTVKLQGVNPESWKSGQYTYEAAEYGFSSSENAGKLLLGVFSSEDKEAPDIKLGIDCETINGWYDLSSCREAGSLSDNKLYTEAEAYADYGYGYRSPMYAFDGDAETFWACEAVSGSYLSADFGEKFNISAIECNAPCASGAPVTVYACSGGKRHILAEGVYLKEGSNVVSFDSIEADKIMLCVTETAVGAVKISEIKVN
ncbi:MAG: carbohydrate binding domain-containing protein [Clostridia bacterium]|nr:carbohydrate binding domain-containing protein [Clostridia bacterium]